MVSAWLRCSSSVSAPFFTSWTEDPLKSCWTSGSISVRTFDFPLLRVTQEFLLGKGFTACLHDMFIKNEREEVSLATLIHCWDNFPFTPDCSWHLMIFDLWNHTGAMWSYCRLILHSRSTYWHVYKYNWLILNIVLPRTQKVSPDPNQRNALSFEYQLWLVGAWLRFVIVTRPWQLLRLIQYADGDWQLVTYSQLVRSSHAALITHSRHQWNKEW